MERTLALHPLAPMEGQIEILDECVRKEQRKRKAGQPKDRAPDSRQSRCQNGKHKRVEFYSQIREKYGIDSKPATGQKKQKTRRPRSLEEVLHTMAKNRRM